MGSHQYEYDPPTPEEEKALALWRKRWEKMQHILHVPVGAIVVCRIGNYDYTGKIVRCWGDAYEAEEPEIELDCGLTENRFFHKETIIKVCNKKDPLVSLGMKQKKQRCKKNHDGVVEGNKVICRIRKTHYDQTRARISRGSFEEYKGKIVRFLKSTNEVEISCGLVNGRIFPQSTIVKVIS